MEQKVENKQQVEQNVVVDTAPTETSDVASQPEATLSCIAKYAVLYGADWNTDTQSARSLFADTTLEYVACDKQADFCQKKSVTAYPTWIINEQNVFIGRMTLEQLKAATDCK